MLRFIAGVLMVGGMSAAFGQLAVSARSGMVNHLEGRVTLAGEPLKLRFGQFPEVAPGTEMAAEDGRAEVLLNPGVFLRLDEHSAFKMVSNKLTDAQVELTSGAALVEVQELEKSNNVTILVGGSRVSLLKIGLYRFDVSPARVRVYDGKAVVAAESGPLTLTKGHEAELGAVPVADKFNTTKGRDELYTWSQYRAQLVAQANLVSARTAQSQGYRMSSSSWAYSPYWGMYTFLPRTGVGYSGFGMYVYSPYTIWQYYTPRYAPAYGAQQGGAAANGNFGGASVQTRGAAASVDSGGTGTRPSFGGGAGAGAAPVSAGAGAAGVGRRGR